MVCANVDDMKIKVSVSPDNKDFTFFDVMTWCYETYGSPLDRPPGSAGIYRWYQEDGNWTKYNFYFFNEEDATLFKLRWL